MNINEYLLISDDEKPFDRIVSDGGMCSIFRTIACVGDSLSSGVFESLDENYKSDGGNYFEYSWGQFLARDCGNKVYNFSSGGMTARWYNNSYADEHGFWNPEYASQAYIIALGVNDILNERSTIGTVEDIDINDYTKNADTFAGHYARIIQRYKEIQPKAKFFLVTPPVDELPLLGNDERNALKKPLRDIIEQISNLFENCFLIDLYTYSPPHDKEFINRYYIGTHLSPTGYRLSATMIESYIDYLIRHNPIPFKSVAFIGRDLCNTTVEK